MPVPTDITIQVAIPAGSPLVPKRIRAEVFGRWAVHRTYDAAGNQLKDNYTVTHVPSGMLLADQLVDKASAVRLAKMLGFVLDVETFDVAKHRTIAEREVLNVRGWV